MKSRGSQSEGTNMKNDFSLSTELTVLSKAEQRQKHNLDIDNSPVIILEFVQTCSHLESKQRTLLSNTLLTILNYLRVAFTY
jgi:hypothetical protein